MAEQVPQRPVDQRGEEGVIGKRGIRGHVAHPHADETAEEKDARIKQHKKDNLGADCDGCKD